MDLDIYYIEMNPDFFLAMINEFLRQPPYSNSEEAKDFDSMYCGGANLPPLPDFDYTALI